jgi:phosphoribosylformylglycinamidine synthase
MGFRAEGDVILLLDGDPKGWGVPVHGGGKESRFARPTERDVDLAALTREFSSSEYARTILGIEAGAPPTVDLSAEKKLIALLVALASDGKLQSAHDISDGGLAVTIAESCFASNHLSANVSLKNSDPDETVLFGERGARAIVSVTPENVAAVRLIAAQYEGAVVEVGRVTRGEFRIELNDRVAVSAEVPSLADAWNGAFGRLLGA